MLFVRLAGLPLEWVGALAAGGAHLGSALWITFLLGSCCCSVQQACCGCTSYPIRYRMPIAGITNGTCLRCDEQDLLNRTWELAWDPLCQWTNGGVGPCTPLPGSDPIFLRLRCPGDGFMWLEFRIEEVVFGFVSIARYRKAITDWLCLGENNVDLVDNTGHCATWPSTLTLTPI